MSVLQEPYVETFVLEDDHPAGLYAFACNICQRSVDDGPCPEHAPTAIAGLKLVDCAAEPRHWLWVHNRDDYGSPCWVCIANDHARRDAEARQCRHWSWRRWRITHWLCGQLYVTGLAASGGVTSWADGCNWCQSRLPHLRGKRPYILWADRNTWRCWLVGRHRRGEAVGFGFCGRCVPWSCCGSQVVEHRAGCPESV